MKRERNKQSAGDFSRETIPHGTAVPDTLHRAPAKMYRVFNSKSEPWRKLRTLGGDDVPTEIHQL